MRRIHARQCGEFVTNRVNGSGSERAYLRLAVHTPAGADSTSPRPSRSPFPRPLADLAGGAPALPLSAGRSSAVVDGQKHVNGTRHTNCDRYTATMTDGRSTRQTHSNNADGMHPKLRE